MTAQGKINASQVEIGNRIIVKVSYTPDGHMTVFPSQTKTGQGVEIVRVIGKVKHSSKRGYMILTSLGALNGFYAEPIQTMWLAPEDPAGRKRAHTEALAEDVAHSRRIADALELEIRQDRAAETQVNNWLADHSNLPHTQWTRVADAREADHAEALRINSYAGRHRADPAAIAQAYADA